MTLAIKYSLYIFLYVPFQIASKQYAFEISDVPVESDYLEIRYNVSLAASVGLTLHSIVSSIFIGWSVYSGQSGLTLRLFPFETIVVSILISQNHHLEQL